MNRLRSNVALLVSGAALAFAFFPLPFRFLSYFALVPLLARIESQGTRRAFWSGLLFGFLFGLGLLYWLLFLVVPPVIKAWLILGIFLLAAFIGLYFAVFSLLTRWLGVFWAPFILVGLEYVRSIGEIGFPWGVLGYSQTPYLPVIQLASIFGVWGISFWIVIVNIFAYRLLAGLLNRGGWLRPLVYLCGTVLVVLAYGVVKMGPNRTEHIRVAIVQPNIDPNQKSTREMKQRMFDILRAESDRVKPCGVDLIILPETALPVNLERERIYYQQVRQVVDSSRQPVFTGSLLYDYRVQGGLAIYNGAVLFMPDSGIVGKYRKMHLVPFSEKMPYSRYIPLLRRIDVGGGDFAHGEDYAVFNVAGKRFSTLICFESIFGDLTRRFARQGCDFLANITNDGWFGNTPGPYQHAEMAALRAVENRMPLVRCANTGISFIVDQYGRISNKTPIFARALVVADVPMGRADSIYLRFGDFLPVFALLAVTLALLVKIISRRADLPTAESESDPPAA